MIIYRVMLGGITVISIVNMVLAIRAARHRHILRHKDYAMRSFLYSIEGAGTIRQGQNQILC